MANPAIKKLIRTGIADQEAAIRLASVNLLIARVDEARSEILAAREEIRAASSRAKKAAQTIIDIERLTAPTVAAPASIQPAGYLPALAAISPAPILPRPEPRAADDWTAPPRSWAGSGGSVATDYDPLSAEPDAAIGVL